MTSPTPRAWSLVGFFTVIFGYLAFTVGFSSPYAGASDSSGYLNSARFLLAGQSSAPLEALPGLDRSNWDPRLQEPYGFLVRRDTGRMVPSYPVGYPLHLAMAGRMVGLDRAVPMVSGFLVLAAAVLMLALARELDLPWSWSIAAAAFLWSNPLFLMFVQVPMSDVPATTWVMAAMLFGLWSRRNWRWAFLAGGSVAIAVLVRPSNLIILLPLGIALGAEWRRWTALILGGLPGAVFLAYYNSTHYGGALVNGAGNPSMLFGLNCVPANAVHYLTWLPVVLSPVIVIAALGLPFSAPTGERKASVLTVWTLTFIGFYLCYREAGGFWWSLRFILPAVPSLILAALVSVQRLWGYAPQNRRLALVLPLTVAFVIIWQTGAAFNLHAVAFRRESLYPAVAEWMVSHLPGDAVVVQGVTSGASTYYTDFATVRWDLLSPSQARQLYAAARLARRPVYAAFVDLEPSEAFEAHLPGVWEPVGGLRQASFWRLKGP